MALIPTNVGTRDDGRPQQHYSSGDPNNPAGIVVYAGAATSGLAQTDDGTLYDLTPHWVEVESLEHAGQVAHHVSRQIEALGVAGPDFTHECTDECGPLAGRA